VALVAQRLMDGYRTLNRPREGLNLLKGYLAEAPSIDLLEVVFKATLELEGVEAVNQLTSAELRRTPSLLGLDKLLDARLMVAPPEMMSDLTVVKNLVDGYAKKWHAISALIAVLRRDSFTGSVLDVVIGKHTLQGALKN